LEQHKQELKDAGLQVIAVAMGEPKHLGRYCESISPSVRCLVKKDTEAYKAYGLEQAGVRELMSLNVFTKGLKAVTSGYAGGPPIGDVRMMPGTFLVDRQGILRYTYYSANIADHPSFEELLRQASLITEG
jgi:peroxiredoxin